MTWMVALAVVIVSLAFSAFFSGAETGLYCVSRIRIQLGVHAHDRAAMRIDRLLKNPASAISCALIGTNLMNYIATSGTAFLFAELFHLRSVDTELYTIAILTPVVFVFGEVVPKSLFQQHPYRLLRSGAGLLSVSSLVFHVTGFVGLVGLISGAFERLVRADQRGAREATPKRRVAALLQEGLIGHAHDNGQAELIDRICRLSETAIQSVMVPRNRIQSIAARADRREFMRLAQRAPFSRLPVYEMRRTHIVGYVDVAHLLTAEDWETVGDRLEPIITLSPHQSVASATAHLQRKGRDIAVVTDTGGMLLGLVTLHDLTDEVLGGLAESN